MQIMQLEREVWVDAYTCEVYSHRAVYGFCVYTKDEDVKQLVAMDFGYDGVETAECTALACIVRVAYDVIEKDHNVLRDEIDKDCGASYNDDFESNCNCFHF